jgi:hypothetical protein
VNRFGFDKLVKLRGGKSMPLSPFHRVLAIVAITITITGFGASNCAANSSAGQSGRVEKPPLYLKVNPLWWIATSKPPADYESHWPLRRIDWFFRNPLHNFSFYVIGISDHVDSPAFHRYGKYPNANFSPRPGWNICVIHYHWLRLPYVAYWNPHVSFYAGWRLAGEFGLKLNIFKHPVESP